MKDAVLVKARVSVWGGQRVDRAVSDEVAHLKMASANAGRYVKNLIDPAAIRGVKTAATMVRATHYDITRPWDDGGRRLCAADMLPEYHTKMDRVIANLDGEADAFISIYPSLVDAARKDLGNMFDEDEYPKPDDLRSMFGVTTEIEPLPSGAALPMGLKDRERIAADIEAAVKANMKESADAMFHRTVKAVRGVIGRIEDFSAKKANDEPHAMMRDGLLNELIGIATLLPRLNIENDPFLDGISGRLLTELNRLDVVSLRASSTARKKALTALEPIALTMEERLAE